MSEIFIIKNTGKGIINSLAPENVVPIKSAGSSDGGGTTGDYIPLSGTEEGKPVTGDIEFTDNKKILWGSKGLIFNFLFSGAFATLSNNYNSKTLGLGSDSITYEDDNNESISVLFYSTEQDYSSIKIQNNNPTNLFRGLVGNIYYGDNYTDNTYIQKLYADKQHSYSTTEYKTGGTWIDGKPIYRKVITENISSDIYSFSIQDLEELVKPIQGTSNYKNIPYNETDNDGANISNKQFRIQYVGDNTFEIYRYETNYVLLTGTFSAQSLNVGSFTITLEYTKTTD